VAADIRRQDARGTIWYVGKGAFEFYSERAGMRRFGAPGRLPRPGEWVVVAEGYVKDFTAGGTAAFCEARGAREWFALLPLRSRYQYGSAAWEHDEGPLARVRLYRLRKDFPFLDAARDAQ
jgi:hypothetical protein